MEPKNHPIEKEHHLPNLHFLGSIYIFQGVGDAPWDARFHRLLLVKADQGEGRVLTSLDDHGIMSNLYLHLVASMYNTIHMIH